MMNKKMIGALLGTFALGSMNVAFADDKPAGGDAPKAEKKAKKGKKGKAAPAAPAAQEPK